ncbi:hypothetical protein EYF80_063556 [Liparis tanakae]|uniref:Uncharacterized protein n=1 Tax=Liparis tanakae TaxID=230148 RepID=A0A4Z2EBP7_9TELE|nr:hypothetical protein EYF80_063556 [Liparis tanakae]
MRSTSHRVEFPLENLHVPQGGVPSGEPPPHQPVCSEVLSVVQKPEPPLQEPLHPSEITGVSHMVSSVF